MNLTLAGRVAVILLFGSMLAACGSTWSGVKEDTGENMEAVGSSVSEAGGAVKDEGEEMKEDAEDTAK